MRSYSHLCPSGRGRSLRPRKAYYMLHTRDSPRVTPAWNSHAGAAWKSTRLAFLKRSACPCCSRSYSSETRQRSQYRGLHDIPPAGRAALLRPFYRPRVGVLVRDTRDPRSCTPVFAVPSIKKATCLARSTFNQEGLCGSPAHICSCSILSSVTLHITHFPGRVLVAPCPGWI